VRNAPEKSRPIDREAVLLHQMLGRVGRWEPGCTLVQLRRMGGCRDAGEQVNEAQTHLIQHTFSWCVDVCHLEQVQEVGIGAEAELLVCACHLQ
jgi:hypothetical protein